MNSSLERDSNPLAQKLAHKNVLVTGASGFIGSHLVRHLVKQGAHPIAVVRPTSDLWRLQDILAQIRLIRSDVLHLCPKTLARLDEIDIIFHLAAAGVNPKRGNSKSVVEINVLGTLQLLELAKQVNVSRFVYCGSCFEYGSGRHLSEQNSPIAISEYAASKSSGWLIAQSFYHRYQLPVASLRPFTVYGPFESPHRLIPNTILSAINNQNIQLTGGKQTRDFIFIDDVIEGFLEAAINPKAVGGTFNLCTGVETSVRTLVSQILNLTETHSIPEFGSVPYRDTELWELSGDPDHSQTMLGWSASHDLNTGLQKTISWFQQHACQHPIYKTP